MTVGGGGGGCDPFLPNKPDLGLQLESEPFAKLGGALGSCLVPTRGVDREKAAKVDMSSTGTTQLGLTARAAHSVLT